MAELGSGKSWATFAGVNCCVCCLIEDVAKVTIELYELKLQIQKKNIFRQKKNVARDVKGYT